MSKAKDLQGQRFGRLLVLSRSPNLGKNVAWYCLCDCGKEKAISASVLYGNITKSCGCLKQESLLHRNLKPPGHSGMIQLFNLYKRTARLKGHLFALEENEFKVLTSSDCHYCGRKPFRTKYNRGGRKEIVERSAYKYNGIDRVDNNQGYVTKNCVSCCFTCNDWKSDMSYNDFIEHIEKIYSKIIKKQNSS
jgi:hypothetical protein